eukprot:Em0005g1001a
MRCILIDAHLSDGDQLVMLDVLEIDLFKMPTSPMGIDLGTLDVFPLMRIDLFKVLKVLISILITIRDIFYIEILFSVFIICDVDWYQVLPVRLCPLDTTINTTVVPGAPCEALPSRHHYHHSSGTRCSL